MHLTPHYNRKDKLIKLLGSYPKYRDKFFFLINFNSTKLTLANTMIIGVIITVCSNNWISIWIGLEISLLSFTPLILNRNKTRSEAIIKYFIIQRVASSIFLFRVISILIGVSIFNEIILTIAILIRIGSAPFHNWVILVIEPIDYSIMLVILTIQKVPPLFILYQINRKWLVIPIMLGILVGSFSCLNQSSIRKTLGFSSIYNISLLISSINRINVTITFLIIYSFILAILVYIVKINRINYINQMIFNEFNPWLKINIWINILSLGGFPPTIGFVSKLMILQLLIVNIEIVLTSIFVLTSMLVLIFYTRLAFSSILTIYSIKKWVISRPKSIIFILSINLSVTPIVITINRVF